VTNETKFPPSGVFLSPPDVQALREKTAQAAVAWFELNLARVQSKREFLAACAKSLRFPQSFGTNWDALADCLKDLCADSVVNCRSCGQFAEAAPDDYATALEIFRDAATYWEERTSTFLVLVDAEPQGATLSRFPAQKKEL
jgi:hypothetical protein